MWHRGGSDRRALISTGTIKIHGSSRTQNQTISKSYLKQASSSSHRSHLSMSSFSTLKCPSKRFLPKVVQIPSCHKDVAYTWCVLQKATMLLANARREICCINHSNAITPS